MELLLGLCGGGSDLGSFNIAAYGKYPPFSWKVQNDAQKKYEGFVPEIVHKALNDIGIKKIHENLSEKQSNDQKLEAKNSEITKKNSKKYYYL